MFWKIPRHETQTDNRISITILAYFSQVKELY